MKRVVMAGVLILGALFPSLAFAAEEFDRYAIEESSASLSSTQAGAHADLTTTFLLTQSEGFPYAPTRDVVVSLPPGFTGNPKGFETCTSAELGRTTADSNCPLGSQVGSTNVTLGGEKVGTIENEPIYNMEVGDGDVVARFGFFAGIYQMAINVRVDPTDQHLVASLEGAPSAADLLASETTLWGIPADPSHDPQRITPEEALLNSGPPGGRSSPLGGETPFMTNPTRCGLPGSVLTVARSYQLPSQPSSSEATLPAITGCGSLEFAPHTELRPTTSEGTSASGLGYELEMPTKGMEYGKLPYGSELKRAEVILPAGMTINPSQAEGLAACSEADLARETYDSGPGAGCPQASKIGTVRGTTPVLAQEAVGALYLAKPYENPFGSLIAIYMVLKIPGRGVLIKVPGKVSVDPANGQITTLFDDLPQIPVGTFRLAFREGERAPLITPPACGSHQAVSRLTPWSAPAKVITSNNTFVIESGPGHGPCPSGTLLWNPGFEAGSLNNAAGAFSPFYMRLTRSDVDRELTRFSSILPPGVTGKIAGLTQCPQADVEAAKDSTATAELALPSCPASSQIGHTLAGAGVGSALTYIPGSLYLGGPYNGDPLSIVSITPAQAGPFDVGTVVVQEALTLNPATAEVEVDGAASDPIPHILQGIPVKLRDLRVEVDRSDFTLNPTNCSEEQAKATLWGDGTLFVPAAETSAGLTARYQAAGCAALGFKPKLSLRLKGRTKRGGNPALTAVLTPRPGDANLGSTSVLLPHSEFIDNQHINNPCTRVQYNSGAGGGAGCPKKSVIGTVKAWTPLLDEPLQGKVYFRSNGGARELPDAVLSLNGLFHIEQVGFIDSVRTGRERSRVRTRFLSVPDAPISRVVIHFFGGRRGLLENSSNLCARKQRARVTLLAQNGRRRAGEEAINTSCPKRRRSHHQRHRHGAR